ncbi:MAG: 2,3-diphosphoglycerate-dependent phosphoglycerate mutase [Bdellovibrionaceae bacterium]|jgi:2,3-bisphosphoglycerate-dependent phosphoglycerate mutase|nr:2,3-diphosphoglycerate-dependent phosphoglycerate mutase [Pseudobdellovibrionaceae bacterium]
MLHLLLLRHGESLWNQENRFTGWVDVDLSPQGEKEAKEAAAGLKSLEIPWHYSYTSVLKRAIKTHFLFLDALDLLWLPVARHWRLNERHYGALQGLNKQETAARYGDEQVKIWRRSLDVPPPFLKEDDPSHPKNDPRYQSVPAAELPRGESLAMTIQRVLPWWQNDLLPRLQQGQNVIVVAHGNSLRAIVQILEKLSPESLLELNMPTGIPLLYTLNSSMSVQNKKYLADPAIVEERLQKAAGHGKAK